jgi:hypothetical protein
MTAGQPRSKYLNTDQDWSTDSFSEAELARMKEWYVETHGESNLDLVKFVEFMGELRPEALKAYRRCVEMTVGPGGPANGLGAASVFMPLHTYAVLCYSQGSLYEIISARGRGATKAEVVDVLSIAWLHSGSQGINIVAGIAHDYMHEWDATEPAGGLPFPDGWARDSEAFRSGLDFNDMTTITQDEFRALKDWHQRVQGEVPAYVSFLGEHYPDALKVMRARYEGVMNQCSLPKQMIALLFLHTAGARRNPTAVRRAAVMAKEFGVTRGQVLHALTHVHRLLGDLFGDAAFESIHDLFDDWE